MSNNQNNCAGKIIVWGVSIANEVRPIGQQSIQALLAMFNCNAEKVDFYSQIAAQHYPIFLSDNLETPQICVYNSNTAAEMLASVERSDTPCIVVDYTQIASYVINDPACKSLEDFMCQLKNILQKKQKVAVITAYVSSDVDGRKLPEWILNLLPFADNINSAGKLLSSTTEQ